MSILAVAEFAEVCFGEGEEIFNERNDDMTTGTRSQNSFSLMARAKPQGAQRARRSVLGAIVWMTMLCGAAWAATNDGTQVLQTNRNGNGKVCQSLADFPVDRLCREYFGGGGHLNAAGGEFRGTMEEAVRIFREALPRNRELISQRALEYADR